MRILAIADVESRSYWDFYQPGKLNGIDLIISCGDLDPDYLSFLATFSHAPVVYIHGNHDEKYKDHEPEGCISIENDIYVCQGVRILGLGGSMRYRKGDYQFTQAQMNMRVASLLPKIQMAGGFDILVSHAPAWHVGDGEDLPHQGFKALRWLMDAYHPRYYMHGHVHPTYGREYLRRRTYKDTFILNAYETYDFEYENEYEAWFNKLRAKESAS